MQISEHTNDELIRTAEGCAVLANQFDKDGSVSKTLNAASAAIRELLFYRRLADQPNTGETLYISAPGDAPGCIRPGEPLPRPFVVAIKPYAQWLIFESAAGRVQDLEAKLAAMTESSQRNADLADNFEKQLVAEQAKTKLPLAQVKPLEDSEEFWQAAEAMHPPKP